MRLRAGVDRHQVGRDRRCVNVPAATPAVASRLVTAGVAAGYRRRISQSRRGRAPGPRRPIAQVAQDAHLAGQLVGDDQVERAASRGVDRLDVGHAQADGQASPGAEVLLDWLSGTDEIKGVIDRKRAVAGVADDQVVVAVAVQVGRDDLRWELAGGQGLDPDETTVRQGRARWRRPGRRRWRARVPSWVLTRRCLARDDPD